MTLAEPRAHSIVPNDLEPYWMPFTANRAFKTSPRLLVRAKDMHYYAADGRKLIDGIAGMWCCNAGHSRDPIVAAIQEQAAELDYATAVPVRPSQGVRAGRRIAQLAPGDLDHVFFANSGSEAVDTALKIALAYHNVRGEGSRQRLIGRERGYHGAGFGGTAVGGIVPNRKMFGTLLAGVDHLPHTYNRAEQAFTKGEPEWGGASRRRAGAPRRPARRLHHRRRDRRADGGLDRRAAAAQGLSRAAARDLRQIRHPADLRRGDHRLRPARPCLRRRALWRHARHDHLRQGRHLRHGADGRRRSCASRSTTRS